MVLVADSVAAEAEALVAVDLEEVSAAEASAVAVLLVGGSYLLTELTNKPLSYTNIQINTFFIEIRALYMLVSSTKTFTPFRFFEGTFIAADSFQ